MSSTEENQWPSTLRLVAPPSKITNGYLEELLKKKMRIKRFRGVFPCDLIPTYLKDGESAIINTHPHDMPGDHYVCLYKKRKKYFYFDPLALDLIMFPYLKEEMEKRTTFKKIVPVLTQPIQHPGSNFCEMVCLSYILSLHSRENNL